MVKYSIIIPVHNNEHTLEQTLDSVFWQRKQFDEIILVENGSNDRSLAIADNYAKEVPAVSVIKSSQSGVSRARNIGVQVATGDYLFFLDADDMIHETLLFELDKYVQQSLTNGQTIDLYEVNFNHYFSQDIYMVNPYILPNGIYRGDDYLTRTLTKFQEESKFMVWRFLYKKGFFLKDHKLFDERLGIFEDVAFMHKYLTKDVTIYVTEQRPLIDYLFHEQSVTRKKEQTFEQSLTRAYSSIDEPSILQQQYFLLLASKILSKKNFIDFAQQAKLSHGLRLRITYYTLKGKNLTRRLKRRWQRKHDSKI